MGTVLCGFRHSAVAIALALAFSAAAPAQASPGVTVFPGMEIHQGATVCMVGFVEPRLRIALSAGRCDDAPTVTDSHANVVGSVVLARRASVSEPVAADSASAVEYEVIALAPEVTTTQLLPGGRRLESIPGFTVQPALPVCHNTISAGQMCGRIGSVGNDGFAITGMIADPRDVGGPVYTLTDDNRAVIVGLLDGVRGTALWAQSWQAVMRQLYIDAQSAGATQPPLGQPIGR
ncbi:hypothetical protein B1987_23205 [Mycobacterium kansasii]|uniref:Peptidase S1 domain-containing protein n=1 Tax=Mycobacterium attenuatum TaxID=2341086 RepID=A0A498PVK5_9MYCO|nr:hypothetical protein [Mycobacterium attenuatum]ORB86193.1 hypothetical protein B1987_23205 [Mycobacterium kansasii]VBA36859.1 hypothetical protein LAUMK136_01615 [Mycobacterium attenuatum]VBA49614.1 hypothetical protein LAUMK191_01607 [Mycobacterium attenuatum]VBA55128.1 hypothetical protein LAUMK41_01680 [Mycobacterium attenuatum]